MTRLLRATRTLRGAGLHSGAHAALSIWPAPRGHGINFVRLDLTPPAIVPALLLHAVCSARRTVLQRGAAWVSTPEHLLAALGGLGVRDAEVRLHGPEVPALDGSAAPFARALIDAGLAPEPGPAAAWRVISELQLRRGAARCALLPPLTPQQLELQCSVHFDHPAVGHQQLRYQPHPARFMARLARARTFGFADEAAGLRRAGLARGASLSCALVFGRHGPLNHEGTRYADEPVRHKLLDALGDLTLLGAPLRGRVLLQRCGHALLTTTLKRAISEKVLVNS